MKTSLGLAPLLRQHLSGVDLTAFGQTLIQRASTDPTDAAALMDASILMQFRGQRDIAMQLQREALEIQTLYPIQSSRPARLKLLAIMAPGDLMSNVPIECLLEESDIALTLCYPSPDELTAESFDSLQFPEHDLLFFAIGESDANRPLLDAWLPRLLDWPRPVLNLKQTLGLVARERVHDVMKALPGILIPPTWRLRTDRLEEIIANNAQPLRSPDGSVNFPLILRPVDSHAGQGLTKAENGDELLAAVRSLPNQEVFLSPFVDYRSRDGRYRKYRLVLIDGRPFACHMGISDHWMIHYLNAGMAESAEKRAEEADFMNRFDQEFAVRHGPALTAIHRAIGLDYLGIDCAETEDGRLLIFEIDPAMVVHAMDPVDLYPYKQPAMRKVFDAFRTMLIQRAKDRGSNTPA
ncbi:ATP-grasp domain-containing protein [Imhoffiella purpurea]|uniref:ATP-grasp domain-containing protein n=1 Tax=Imhoffiella purpurea TaxID=1249627 RepID=W9V283_9GAMM|nr:glutathione synthase [Imhoffiella purpurea]EXJ13419.1 hypothetical protein D779_3743 [Imhoffiella purpurea]